DLDEGAFDPVIELGGIEVRRVAPDVQTVRTDVEISLRSAGNEQLGLRVRGRRSAYDPATVSTWARSLATFIDGCLSEDAPLAYELLPLADPGSADASVVVSRDPAETPFDLSAKLAEIAETRKPATAVIEGDRVLTFQELSESVDELALRLLPDSAPRHLERI